MTLGEIIKEYRKENGLSMDNFSERSGISKSYISLLEKNKHPKTGKPIAPSIQSIKQAANGMRMDFDTLFSMLDGNVTLNSPASAPTPLLTARESDLLSSFRELNDDGQDEVLKYVGYLNSRPEYIKSGDDESMDKA